MESINYILNYVRIKNTGAEKYDLVWEQDFFILGAFEESLTTPSIVVEVFNNSYNSMIAAANRISNFSNINGILEMTDPSKINKKCASVYLPTLTSGTHASVLIAYMSIIE
jgi:hypothetical protein